MKRYRKKPVVIEAVQWDGSVASATRIIEWVLDDDGSARWHDPDPKPWISINTLEGTMNAVPGDWIIKGVQREFYPCKPDIFEATYEAVE